MRYTKLTFLALNRSIKFTENMLFSDLLDNDRISTDLFFFKNRDINTKMDTLPSHLSTEDKRRKRRFI